MTTRRMLIALFVAWTAFAYRFSAPYFHNDHFEHLSMARQMLFGELPTRDFIDPGRPLTVALSALGQWIAPNLLSEALLTMGALAVGATLVFWLAGAAARSSLLGIGAAAVVIAILPRLYSYPKILVFAVALFALWRYIDVPTTVRLAWLAAAVVFAFLMRYDFGVYAGLAAALAVFVTPRPFAWRRTLLFIGLGLLCVAPYFGWLESIGRLRPTWASGSGQVVSMASAGAWPAVHFDLSHGLVHIDPIVARVRIRWAPGVDTAGRHAAEAAFGLVDGVDEGERTFGYGLTDGSTGNIRELVNDPRVEDTGGDINRQTLTLNGAWFDRALSATGVTRIVWGPFFNAWDAGVWLYYFVWAIPIAALLRLLGKRGAESTGFSNEWRKIASAAVLGVLLNLYLIRGSFDSRIPDVIVPAAIVGAWLTREFIEWTATRTRLARLPLAAAGAAVAILFWTSLTTYESTATVVRVTTGGLRTAALRKAATELAQRPIDFYAAPGENGMKRLTRYVYDCLRPDDRLLLVSYEPQVFYYSERLFAGGMEYFHAHRFSSDAELRDTVQRLSRQRVPLVIVERARAQMFEESYQPVADYVRTHFHRAATSTFADNGDWDIYATNARPVVSTRAGGLPCYR